MSAKELTSLFVLFKFMRYFDRLMKAEDFRPNS